MRKPARRRSFPLRPRPLRRNPLPPRRGETRGEGDACSAPAAVAERPAELRENIFFRIGSSQIRTTEEAKVGALVEYLKANPEANVEIVGYADAATGSHAVNLKISKLRAESVAAALKKAGIAASASAPRAGRHRPAVPRRRENRVSICIAK
ncbi:MAG: OmpA family protein [Alistipes sp.]